MSNLIIPPDIFEENYNIPLTSLVDRHTFRESVNKGKTVINYLSHALATKIFRVRHPDLVVVMHKNPDNNSYIFEEAYNGGFYMRGHIEDNEGNTSEEVYFALLTTANVAITKDKFTAKDVNTAFARAKTKIIAIVTGIGLKLWTGDDLSDEIKDEKLAMLKVVYSMADKYKYPDGTTYVTEVTILDSADRIKEEGRKIKALLDATPLPPTVEEAAGKVSRKQPAS